MNVFFSAEYVDTEVGFDTTRKAAAIAASLQTRPIPGVVLVEPRRADREDLLTVHDATYVDAVLTGKPLERAMSNELAGWDAGLARAVLASTGGVRDAALHALTTGTIAGSLSSGLHHAYFDHGSGYCTCNGLVVAARAAIVAGAQRVLILDLDAHCGGGTASLIESIAQVEQIDVSVDAFDTYENRSDVRLSMATAGDYLEVVGRELERIVEPMAIDLVLYNAGMDPHEGAGGVPGIDAAMLDRREQMVFEWATGWSLPVAWVLAGGYTDGNEHASISMSELVELHRSTITAAATA